MSVLLCFFRLYLAVSRKKRIFATDLSERMRTDNKTLKIVYCIPALYLAGGMERVLTLKVNYFAEHFGYDITVILTDGKGKPFFYPLSPKIHVINLDIGFEELWNASFVKKTFLYLKKQRLYKQRLTAELMRLRPDVTVSLLRREINFLCGIKDGSRKVGEIHINRAHYRTFEEHETSMLKNLFSKLWMCDLLRHLRRLDRFVVLTESDKDAWQELEHVEVIPNPMSFVSERFSSLTEKRVIVVGRYCHEKGYDHLLQAWSLVQDAIPDWRLDVFGDGDRTSYDQLMDQLHIRRDRCRLNGRSDHIEEEFLRSSIAVCSSRFEGFGMVIVEAMACGVPVVSFDCPWGPRHIITDGRDGMLVENGNVEQLAEALKSLMSHPDRIMQMGEKARVNVRRFSMETIAEQWRHLFESLN